MAFAQSLNINNSSLSQGEPTCLLERMVFAEEAAKHIPATKRSNWKKNFIQITTSPGDEGLKWLINFVLPKDR